MRLPFTSGTPLNGTITSEDILGNEVIDRDGRSIGIVEKVLIDPKSLQFIGISVDKGFLKRGLSIGRHYIRRVAAHAVFLTISVVYEMKNMQVFDNQGAYVGRVSGVELFGTRNKVKSVRVRRFPFPGVAPYLIPSSALEEIGENLILNISKNELLFDLGKKGGV